MHFFSNRRSLLSLALTSVLVAIATLVLMPPWASAQGGEPQYFAIRGAKVIPVSGPPIEMATVVISHGLITAVGKDVSIPAEAWVIDGTGLTVYPASWILSPT